MFLLRGFIDFLTAIIRRPKFLCMTIVIVGACFLITGVYDARVVTGIPVYVIDHDNSTISRTMRTFLAASSELQVMGTLDTPEQAKEAFMDGSVAAIVYIPSGLSQSVKTQNGGHVFAFIDGSNMLAARNTDKAIQTVVKTTSVGIAMVTLQKQGVPDFELLGALQPVNLDVDRPFNALTTYTDYLIPVFLFFNLSLFIILLTCGVFQEPIPENVSSHKIRKRFYYFGRLIAVFILSMIGGYLIYRYGLPRVDIVLNSTPLMALSALVIFVILTQFLYSTINLILPKGFAMSLSYLICMMSIMFSGMTWPLEMMPWYIHEIATWIPLTPFLQSVQVFLYHDANWGDLSQYWQMFIKQAVLYTILLFVVMRFRDIILCIKCIYKKIKSRGKDDDKEKKLDKEPNSKAEPKAEAELKTEEENDENPEGAETQSKDATSVEENESESDNINNESPDGTEPQPDVTPEEEVASEENNKSESDNITNENSEVAKSDVTPEEDANSEEENKSELDKKTKEKIKSRIKRKKGKNKSNNGAEEA